MQKMIYFHGIVQLGLLLKVSQFLAFEPFLVAVLDMIKIRVSFEFEENSRMFFFIIIILPVQNKQWQNSRSIKEKKQTQLTPFIGRVF